MQCVILMEQGKTINHVIPHVGLSEVTLYPPADRIYALLFKNNEKKRLCALRHLGTSSHAFPGSRQMRWDYTVTMLYYSSLVRVIGSSNCFRLDGIEYSSLAATLQCAALVWNIGHLPGTFSVEKGVYRYLHSKNPTKPANLLLWPTSVANNIDIDKIIKRANELLKRYDYLGLARVLAVLKLLKFCAKKDDWHKNWVSSFAAPFLLNYQDKGSQQWYKHSIAFPIIRHCAYLTVDYSISGMSWGPNIPLFFKSIVNQPKNRINDIADVVSEVLSPFERQTYQNIYHNIIARKEAAIVADHVYKYLNKVENPKDKIEQWMSNSMYQKLGLGRIRSRSKHNVAASFKLRSHFHLMPDSIAKIEKELKSKGLDLPIAFKYRPWNSDALIEPDELLIDIVTSNKLDTCDVGKLLAWCVSNFENFKATKDDYLTILHKIDLERAYLGLINQALKLSFPGIEVRLQPWPLRDYGIFEEYLDSNAKGGIWAANSLINDSISTHIIRDRSARIPSRMKEIYTEMQGLSKLRQQLRRQWSKTHPRQKCLLVTASVKFTKPQRELIEYDGGLITVSSRGGNITWYGLESKSSGTNPKSRLKRKLEHLGIKKWEVFQINSKHAYVKMPIK